MKIIVETSIPTLRTERSDYAFSHTFAQEVIESNSALETMCQKCSEKDVWGEINNSFFHRCE